LSDEVNESVLAKEFARVIRRLDHPVGEQHQDITGSRCDLLDGIAGSFQHAEDRSTGGQPIDFRGQVVAAPYPQWRRMSGIDVAQAGNRGIERAPEQGREPIFRRLGHEEMIQLGRAACFVIRDSPVRAAHGSMDQAHQQRRGDAMARHVAHEEGISPTWKRDDVEKVPADSRRRKTFSGDVNARWW